MARRAVNKDELYAQNLAAGMEQLEAYEKAGFKPNKGNASRKAQSPEIQARVAEINDAKTKAFVVDRQWVMDELIKVHHAAFSDSKFSACNDSLKLVGQELGMFIDRKDIRVHAMFERVPDLELIQQIAKVEQELKAIEGDVAEE